MSAMRTPPLLGQFGSLLTRQPVRSSGLQSRFFNHIHPKTQSRSVGSLNNSPLLNLLSRHAGRPSVRHLFSRQRNTQRRLLSEKKPDISSSKDYNPTKNLGSPSPTNANANLSLSQRLKKLSREYGWTAVGVYFFLSALDFPFCFLAVRLIGTDKIAAAEHAVVSFIRRAIPFQIPERWGGQGRLSKKVEEEVDTLTTGFDHGVRQAEELNKGDSASIWTQLALAYAIHKSFIFLRVPLTAAILPKVVKTLRGWGYNIGKRTPKVQKAAGAASKEH